MKSKIFTLLVVLAALMFNSCVFGAYSTVAGVVDDIKQYTIEDMQIRIDALEGEVRVLNLRQSYLEEILILILELTPKPFNHDNSEEEVDHAI